MFRFKQPKEGLVVFKPDQVKWGGWFNRQPRFKFTGVKREDGKYETVDNSLRVRRPSEFIKENEND